MRETSLPERFAHPAFCGSGLPPSASMTSGARHLSASLSFLEGHDIKAVQQRLPDEALHKSW